MFFSISKTKNDPRFNIQHVISGFNIHLDLGWSRLNKNDIDIFYKGYCDTSNLEEIVTEFIDDNTPRYTGNFCIILIKKDEVTITHDYDRSFPLKYYDNDILTNLPYDPAIAEPQDDIWSDSIVTYMFSKIKKENFAKFLNHDSTANNISIAECVYNVKKLLVKKLHGLDFLNDEINVFLSGGIDTTMVYSLLNHQHYSKKNINIIAGEYYDFTEFTTKNSWTFNNIQQLWGYRQFHHWKEKTIYATGGMGDEIFMRGPTTAAIWCSWHDIDLIKILLNLNYSYHKKYFLLEKNKKIIESVWNDRKKIQKKFKNYSELCTEICNIVSNDHQHWHLENTISWTPLKDIRILENILKLSTDDLLDQIINGSVDKTLISELYPGMEKYICTHKNINQYDNLLKFPNFLEKITHA